ncbi:hypothetical protein CJ255_17990 [Candidatus Viridilinea mediisalina]|uniref:Uncharacterized protein n=1 Tax=Candidatus Viridilinea mediisalina TaxID=2024553 RepID=A0A2A6REX2_9CHLR|nr:hypothetical protein CJ255_17990 [Candidatus Viridilinea mediisalina]
MVMRSLALTPGPSPKGRGGEGIKILGITMRFLGWARFHRPPNAPLLTSEFVAHALALRSADAAMVASRIQAEACAQRLVAPEGSVGGRMLRPYVRQRESLLALKHLLPADLASFPRTAKNISER